MRVGSRAIRWSKSHAPGIPMGSPKDPEVGRSNCYEKQLLPCRPAFTDPSGTIESALGVLRTTRKLPREPACHRNSYRYLPISLLSGPASPPSGLGHSTVWRQTVNLDLRRFPGLLPASAQGGGHRRVTICLEVELFLSESVESVAYGE